SGDGKMAGGGGCRAKFSAQVHAYKPSAPRPRQDKTATDSERHGVSAFGDLKYLPDFEHFDYVEPNTPTGGTFSQVGATRAFNQNFLRAQDSTWRAARRPC